MACRGWAVGSTVQDVCDAAAAAAVLLEQRQTGVSVVVKITSTNVLGVIQHVC